MARLLSDLPGNQNHQTNSTGKAEADGPVTAVLGTKPPDGQFYSQDSYVLSSCSGSHSALRGITPAQPSEAEQIGVSASAHELSDTGPSKPNTFARSFSGLSKTPQQIPKPPFEHPRLPIREDFQGITSQVSYDLIPHSASDTESDIKYIVLVLHDYGESEKSLADFTKSYLMQPETAYLLLRAPNSVDKGYAWSNAIHPEGAFFEATERIISIIHDVLTLKCSFLPRNILLFGLDQGGSVALTVAAAWKEIELGGIMSIGGPIPPVIQADGKKIKTPALVIGGSLGKISAQAEQHIRDLFLHVEVVLKTGFGDFLPKKDDIGPVDAFFAHRLRREEWTKQAILTLGELVLRRKSLQCSYKHRWRWY
jgi:predicted esterase